MNEIFRGSLVCLFLPVLGSLGFAQSLVQGQGTDEDSIVRKWLPVEIESWQRKVQDRKRAFVTLSLYAESIALGERQQAAIVAMREKVAALEVKAALESASNPGRKRLRAAAAKIEYLINADPDVKSASDKLGRYEKILRDMEEHRLIRLRREYFEKIKIQSENAKVELGEAKIAAHKRITKGTPRLDQKGLEDTPLERQLKEIYQDQAKQRAAILKLDRGAKLAFALDDWQLAQIVVSQLRENLAELQPADSAPAHGGD